MLLIVGILLLFGLVVRHKWRNGAAKKEAILRLVAVTSEEEAQIAKLQAIEQYNSQNVEYTPQPNNTQQLEAQHFCAVCRCPTTTRCSRCKAVRYCSGKCQIIHWRQGHRDECQPPVALYATKKSEYVVETAPENQFSMHLKNESKSCSDPNEECDDSASSGSSMSSFFSSTNQSESSAAASTNEDVECQPTIALPAKVESEFVVETAPEITMHLKVETEISDPMEECGDSRSSGTHSMPDKAPSVGIDSHIHETVSYVDDANVLSTSHPACSVNKIKGSLKSTNLEDKRKGGGVAAREEFLSAESELGSPQPNSSARISSAGDWGNPAQTSTSRVMRSKSAKTSGNNEMQNIDRSSEYSKSSKLPQSHDYKKNEVCTSMETKSVTMSTSSGKCQRTYTDAGNPEAVSLETEGVRILSQSTGKGLKTSVRKLAQHFRVPKQSKIYTLDVVKDSGDNHNNKVIFSIKLFMQLYSSDNGLHPFGLANCGNSCYANAVLQCLIFTRPITSYLLQGLHSKSCRKRDWCFICEFEHLIRKGQETNSPLSPVGLLSHIQPIGREEDAHEFLRNVVDKMQSICLEEAGVSGSFAEDSTLMGLTFGGYLRSKIKCTKCLGRSERHDRMLDLTVEIDGEIYTLEQALAQFTSSETLGGDDKYKCNRCKSYEKAKKKLTMLEAPNVLTVVLKRFLSGNFEKLMVVHLGVMNGTYSGHYVSYVKNSKGHWFRIDDSRVSRVDLATVLSAEAYILFYARHSPRGASFGRNSNMYSDAKAKKNTEAIPSSINSKKKNPKSKLSSSGRSAAHWMSPNDFGGSPIVDPEDWEFQVKQHKKHAGDSSSDSSSIFSTSDAGSYSTDSTKDSSAEDLSGYLFGPNWYHP
ncbi:ubiquitinyl hydrolase 1 [Salvia divinorum]|uniref:Ubiquitinyl hydrolase 1 n=1 Tax=Salvia divinorum TaxID=28513 RepID=A0ABD1ILX0_SALDI